MTPVVTLLARGIGAGLISYVLIKVAHGKPAQVPWLLWVVAALFVVYFLRGPWSRGSCSGAPSRGS